MSRKSESPYRSLLEKKPEERILRCLSVDKARYYCALPVKIEEGTLSVICSDQVSDLEIKGLREDFPGRVSIIGKVEQKEFEKAFRLFYVD